MDVESSEPPVVSFRPAKRQKFLRKRLDSSDDVPPPGNATIEPTTETAADRPGSHEDEDESSPVSTLARPRKFQRMRKAGVEFSTASSRPTEKNQSLVLSTDASEDDLLKAKLDRFTAHTGQQIDVDKHMMEFIESELAKRQNRTQDYNEVTETGRLAQSGANDSFTNNFAKREPATLGKLHEIDLGQETKLQNIARTKEATQRLVGGNASSVANESSSHGTNSKSWKNRRRTSEDIERDRLVEEVLRESKLDVYDEPEQATTYEDQAADDRIAEQFRRDFMEAIQSRRRNRAAPNTNNKRVAKPEAPRGPKLGGSRSARAAMREMQEKTGKK